MLKHLRTLLTGALCLLVGLGGPVAAQVINFTPYVYNAEGQPVSPDFGVVYDPTLATATAPITARPYFRGAPKDPKAFILINPDGTAWSASGGSSFPLLAPNGTAGAPSYSWTTDATSGFYRTAGTTVNLSIGGTRAWYFTSSLLNSNVSTGPALVNVAAALATPTLVPNSTNLNSGISTSSTGNTLYAVVNNTAPISFTATGIQPRADMAWNTDNANDIGASGASRPRDLFLGRNLVVGGNATITGGSITGITDLAVADGGTGASTAAAARTNLGIGMTKIGSGTASAVASYFVTGFTSTYSRYRLMMSGYRCSSSGATSYLRVSNDNQATTYSGSTYYGAGYDSRSSDGTPSAVNSSAQTSAKLTNDMISGGTTSPGMAVLDITTSAGEYFMVAGQIAYQSSASGYRASFITATVDKNSVTDVLFGCSAGNISFTWTLYGYL